MGNKGFVTVKIPTRTLRAARVLRARLLKIGTASIPKEFLTLHKMERGISVGAVITFGIASLEERLNGSVRAATGSPKKKRQP